MLKKDLQDTISCPHSYPLFYEPLGLDVSIEIDPLRAVIQL
jgi:hypothetical protein